MFILADHHKKANFNETHFIRYRFIILIILFLLTLSNAGISQPVTSCNLAVKLYDKDGKAIDYNFFRKNIKYMGAGNRADATPWQNKFITGFYDKSKGSFNLHTQSPNGGDFRFVLIYKKDTMWLVIKPLSETLMRHSFSIDSLSLRKGKFYIQPTEQHLSTIDLRQAETNYYNRTLQWYKGLLWLAKNDTVGFNEKQVVREMRSLKKQFNIAEEDNEPKTTLPGELKKQE